MTIDDAIRRLDQVREFLDDCEYRGREEDIEALAMVLEFVRGKADARQLGLPCVSTDPEGRP